MFLRSTPRLSTKYYLKRQCRHSSVLAVQQCLNTIDKHNSEINAFVSINNRQLLEQKAIESDNRYNEGKALSPIDGAPIAIKDNICTKSLPTTCASNMLKDFTSPYDATVVQLLNDAGALIVGKTNMDEFGMGSANVHSVYGPVVNPYDLSDKRVAGGSSGGSAASVAANMCRAALGSDTGGSVRMPASYCGVVGFKPSYGRCSRNGLISYANSLDTIGILAKTVNDCSDVYNIISEYDELDPTSIPVEFRNELDEKDNELKSKWQDKEDLSGLVVGIPQEFYVDSLSDKVVDVWRKGIEKLKNLGAEIVPVSMPHVPLALPAYYIIALAEASSNLARFDGMKYGYRSKEEEEDQLLFSITRSQGFGAEVQRRILLGTHVLTAGTYETLFLPAQKARRLIQQDFDNVFKQPNLLHNQGFTQGSAHILLIPSATSDAPILNNRDELVTEYMNDVMTLPANLAGIPAITIPFGQDKYPIGLQLLSQYGYDQFLQSIAQKLLIKTD